MRLQQESLAELMNGPIRKHLGDIPDNVTWGGNVCVCVCVRVYLRSVINHYVHCTCLITPSIPDVDIHVHVYMNVIIEVFLQSPSPTILTMC